MTQGYVSDADGDDTVMDSPHVTVSIDLTQLPPAQALAIAQAAGFDQQYDYSIGQLAQGDADPDDLQDAEFHLPIGVGLTALAHVGAIELPSNPEDVDLGENQQG
jgi:hypothetical protein